MTEALLIILFFFFLYRLIKNIGKSFPLFDLVIVLYLLQYGIAPLLEYNIDPLNSMSISKEEYISFATFSCLAFIIGLFSVKNKFKKLEITVSSELASNLGRAFLLIALFGNLAVFFLPYSLRAILTFFVILKSPGVFCLIYSDKKLDKIIIALIFLQTAISSILNAMLIEFIVFTVFFAMFYSLRYEVSTKLKYTIIAIGILFLSVYQGVKQEYRENTWEEEIGWQGKVAILTDLISIDSFTAAFDSDLDNNESIVQTVHRLNQGWQTSMVVNHVPKYVDFENGSALKDDILSSIMPRFLMPNKRVVNDYERYNHYTGYILNDQTSMSVGVIGDFYLNFGFNGTLVSMFVFGFFMAKVCLWFYKKYIVKNPIDLVWLPFIFSYFIRPGNEFYMVLNHLIKAFIIFFLVRKFLYPYIYKRLALKSSRLAS
ncbi:hypothetical protein ESY86_09850 [Subsaximicrobium wynnwilliamsii]|uniref:Oligosaccharide repeat unit polymerase n=1 Tax=Subsaximicrobium wynnwilliamsii TaxID=291179 RepID=A0A5C6ZHZ9_9FLAO|nr:hypothetical protein [Subsaximicrobium wynnwilliamsii]TXD81373.1 hypothetical protein ESY87_18500 [Subsaximicrobium wynnwilliamsii]TXD89069.1 hypothetical protein ESY86_09850 [Subsaximicrobium wynnwilliamsii]TXE00747.1 hypothetical protein ESY88_18595 [Subsaximicrobium wynnwilliamsii]